MELSVSVTRIITHPSIILAAPPRSFQSPNLHPRPPPRLNNRVLSPMSVLGCSRLRWYTAYKPPQTAVPSPVSGGHTHRRHHRRPCCAGHASKRALRTLHTSMLGTVCSARTTFHLCPNAVHTHAISLCRHSTQTLATFSAHQPSNFACCCQLETFPM